MSQVVLNLHYIVSGHNLEPELRNQVKARGGLPARGKGPRRASAARKRDALRAITSLTRL